MHHRFSWRTLPYHWLLPLAFFCIGLIYLYASPHFESPDSVYHVGVIKHIAETGALPVQSPDHDELYAHEGSQPPLYYLLMTPLWRMIDTSDFAEFLQLNPLVFKGHPDRLGNRSFAFYRQPHPPDLRGASLALYLIRLATLAMGALTIYAIYQAARALAPRSLHLAILAAAFAAFNPQFLYIASSVSNDALVSMLAALATWQMIVMLREGFDRRRSFLLGLLIALASLTKLGGLYVGLIVALCGLWIAIRDRDWRGFVALAAWLAALWLIIAGWWYARNLMLYGELFGTNMLIAHFGGRSASLSQIINDEFQGLRLSYWGLFGWFSIFTSRLHYLAMDALSLLAAAGLAIATFVNRRNRFTLSAILLLSLLVAIAGASLLWYTMRTTSSQGRLLFPVIGAISLLLALGIQALRLPAPLVALPMMIFASAAPFAYIMPQYDHPPPVDRLPASAVETEIRWEDIALVGYELPAPTRWSPGDEIPLTLYWRPLKATDEPQALFISLIGAEGDALATIDSFPGWGTLPTTWWQPGVSYKDDYVLQIPTAAQGLSNVQLHIGWYVFPDGVNIQPVLAAGERIDAFTILIGAFVDGAARETLGADASAIDALFDDAISLDTWRFSDGRLLELEWRLTRAIGGDLRVFAIVLAEAYQPGKPFEIIAQADNAPPARLDFLRAGETFVTRHEFELPPDYSDEYSVYIGWYDQELGQRLSAPYPANMLELPAFRLSAPGK